jgi:hypothetical protein
MRKPHALTVVVAAVPLLLLGAGTAFAASDAPTHKQRDIFCPSGWSEVQPGPVAVPICVPPEQ